jgi:hypothetical protein
MKIMTHLNTIACIIHLGVILCTASIAHALPVVVSRGISSTLDPAELNAENRNALGNEDEPMWVTLVSPGPGTNILFTQTKQGLQATKIKNHDPTSECTLKNKHTYKLDDFKNTVLGISLDPAGGSSMRVAMIKWEDAHPEEDNAIDYINDQQFWNVLINSTGKIVETTSLQERLNPDVLVACQATCNVTVDRSGTPDGLLFRAKETIIGEPTWLYYIDNTWLNLDTLTENVKMIKFQNPLPTFDEYIITYHGDRMRGLGIKKDGDTGKDLYTLNWTEEGSLQSTKLETTNAINCFSLRGKCAALTKGGGGYQIKELSEDGHGAKKARSLSDESIILAAGGMVDGEPKNLFLALEGHGTVQGLCLLSSKGTVVYCEEKEGEEVSCTVIGDNLKDTIATEKDENGNDLPKRDYMTGLIIL